MTPSTVTGETPAKLFIGRVMKSRLDLVKPQLQRHEAAFTSKEQVNVVYGIGDLVYTKLCFERKMEERCYYKEDRSIFI